MKYLFIIISLFAFTACTYSSKDNLKQVQILASHLENAVAIHLNFNEHNLYIIKQLVKKAGNRHQDIALIDAAEGLRKESQTFINAFEKIRANLAKVSDSTLLVGNHIHSETLNRFKAQLGEYEKFIHLNYGAKMLNNFRQSTELNEHFLEEKLIKIPTSILMSKVYLNQKIWTILEFESQIQETYFILKLKPQD